MVAPGLEPNLICSWKPKALQAEGVPPWGGPPPGSGTDVPSHLYQHHPFFSFVHSFERLLQDSVLGTKDPQV